VAVVSTVCACVCVTVKACSPLTQRAALGELMDREMLFARDKKPASIWLKLNSLVDPQLIDKLYQASRVRVARRDVVLTHLPLTARLVCA
jgi:polyphosphate kinase